MLIPYNITVHQNLLNFKESPVKHTFMFSKLTNELWTSYSEPSFTPSELNNHGPRLSTRVLYCVLICLHILPCIVYCMIQ